ncbi:aspartate aminotransferase [Kitasatospora sp. NA04385]|uniref:aminotransferase class I/II-fold pyridoxal phosphate-dependent enzyme n=1 Tax=Kitasatospora sp. NA04385 TaxID=2742135 RepID=UPI0015928787|nr:aminotransferase class I/II-fold pyridoxal phosphate-dependent enzyme [Kitasatospora sp. NA04385]QKW23057.1 aspartate aminotransferase [Kitasatospora sp. NA04385]
MRFDAFQAHRQQLLAADPSLLDAAETNVYRALAPLRPEPPGGGGDGGGGDDARTVYRCDLARTWLRRYGLPEEWSRRAMVGGGVRHGLDLLFRHLRTAGARLWLPADVYPVYFELARAAGLAPGSYPTLPAPVLPQAPPDDRPEYLLLANPSKPLGRHLTDAECAGLAAWLEGSPHRRLLIDAVYDLGTPFAPGTRRLLETGRTVLLHSATKGWLHPRTFGIVLLGPDDTAVAEAFRGDPPGQDRLRLAERLLADHADTPRQVADALAARAERLFARLPAGVLAEVPAAARTSPGNYFFPVDIPAEALLAEHGLLAIPATAFGDTPWTGSVLTSLAPAFAPVAPAPPAPATASENVR